MKSALFILILFLPYVVAVTTIWNRVPKYASNRYITEFVYDRGITDCFQNIKDENTLQLKCWRDNELVNVELTIKAPRTKRRWNLESIFT